ncbi:MAG: aminotransferase class I/II-fold pyridoxal phosphate-dependent enzyme, partial [Bacteroidota bacterium]
MSSSKSSFCQKISPQTKAILVNSPHNPSGTIWQKEDLEELTLITIKSWASAICV